MTGQYLRHVLDLEGEHPISNESIFETRVGLARNVTGDMLPSERESATTMSAISNWTTANGLGDGQLRMRTTSYLDWTRTTLRRMRTGWAFGSAGDKVMCDGADMRGAMMDLHQLDVDLANILHPAQTESGSKPQVPKRFGFYPFQSVTISVIMRTHLLGRAPEAWMASYHLAHTITGTRTPRNPLRSSSSGLWEGLRYA
jgi:hypothetical protein